MKNPNEKFKWEKIDDESYNYGADNEFRNSDRTYRAKVIGGWLIKSEYLDKDNSAVSLVFVSDPNHTWTLRDSSPHEQP